MITLLLAAAMTVSPAALKAPGLRYFPSDYYDTAIHQNLEKQVLETWPGPTELIRIWENGDANLGQQLALLLGGSAYHDRQLLPVYREALQSSRPRIRQAAAYGYRMLIADAAPDVSAGVSVEAAAALTGELDAVVRTLRESSLVEMWLASILASRGQPPPGWRGVVLRRNTAVGMRAVERLADPFDLPSVVWAYESTDAIPIRRGLLRLIEGFSLQTFIVIPKGNKAGWGGKHHDEAIQRYEAWSEAFCDQDVEQALARGFAAMGLEDVSPFESQGCEAWLWVIDRGSPQWWPVAARQLYRCGGPAVELSILRKDTEENTKKRERIRSFFGIGRSQR